MKPIEKARELAHCDTCDTCDNSNYLIPSKNCILKIDLSIAMQMYEWTKSEVVQWIKQNAGYYADTTNDNCPVFYTDALIKDLNKYLEL